MQQVEICLVVAKTVTCVDVTMQSVAQSYPTPCYYCLIESSTRHATGLLVVTQCTRDSSQARVLAAIISQHKGNRGQG